MQKIAKKNEAPKGKKKYLNVIYFIDAHKTRSFNLSLTKLNVLFSAFCLIVIWSLLSIIFVGKSFEEKETLRDHLYASLDTIFEYQSRYDGVYETAYPSMESKIVAATDTSTADNRQQANPAAYEEFIDDSLSSDSEGDEQDSAAHTATRESQNIALSVDQIDSDTASKWPVVVEDITFNKEEGDLELNFAIKNNQSPERAQGYIWSVATLKNSVGEKIYMASPAGLKVGRDGKVEDPTKGANWYSIRYYKAKSFYFHLPEDKKDDLHEITIGMMDLQGHKNIYKLPVTKELLKKVQAPSSQAPTAVKR